MTTPARACYRFPAEIIGHAVWLYFRFPLGLRMVEELLAARVVNGEPPPETPCCTTGPGAKAVTDKDFPLANLPAHIEETVRSLAQLHADHHQNATPHERAVARTTALLAHPRFIGGLAIVVAVWMTLNLLAGPLGYRALDPPPFSWLEGAVSLASLYIVVLILATQRREDQLTQRREQLTARP